jgi:hypothetical protein
VADGGEQRGTTLPAEVVIDRGSFDLPVTVPTDALGALCNLSVQLVLVAQGLEPLSFNCKLFFLNWGGVRSVHGRAAACQSVGVATDKRAMRPGSLRCPALLVTWQVSRLTGGPGTARRALQGTTAALVSQATRWRRTTLCARSRGRFG